MALVTDGDHWSPPEDFCDLLTEKIWALVHTTTHAHRRKLSLPESFTEGYKDAHGRGTPESMGITFCGCELTHQAF